MMTNFKKSRPVWARRTLRFFQLFIILTVPLAQGVKLRRRRSSFQRTFSLKSWPAARRHFGRQGRTKAKPTWDSQPSLHDAGSLLIVWRPLHEGLLPTSIYSAKYFPKKPIFVTNSVQILGGILENQVSDNVNKVETELTA